MTLTVEASQIVLAAWSPHLFRACDVDYDRVDVASLCGSPGEDEGSAEEHPLRAGGEYQVARVGCLDEGSMRLDVEAGQCLAEAGEPDDGCGLFMGEGFCVVAGLEVAAEDTLNDAETVRPPHSWADLVAAAAGGGGAEGLHT
jgi:hypothetical protein